MDRAGVAPLAARDLHVPELRQGGHRAVDAFLELLRRRGEAPESGLDLAQRLVEDGFGAGATVVLISTRAEEDVADLVAVSPAAGFLPKAELAAAAIRRIVEGNASARRER